MALNAPLNSRQLEVLQWISDGCPDGRWPDFTFKTTANALASRRLATVSKRGGVWSAGLLPAGEYYLANERYPRDHWNRRRRGRPVELDVPVRAPAVSSRPVVASAPEGAADRPPKKSKVPEELTPTRKLVKRIVDAGGMLEIDIKDDNTTYKSLIGIINRRGMAPDGQEVIMVQGKTYHHLVFRLSSVSDWKSEPPADTMAAERIGRWHPSVATLRTEKRLDSIGKELRGRAFRLLHALAREAEARGHTVRLPQRSRHGYIEDSSKLVGDLIFKINGIECSADIRHPQDRLLHTPTPAEIEREKRYSWDRPPKYDYVPSSRLSIVIDTSAKYQSKETWTDTKTLPLHVRLPDVMMTFERWAVGEAERQEAEQRATVERRAREEREAEHARQAYFQHTLSERLITDANDWELVGRIRVFLDEMSRRIDDLADEEERAAAIQWLHWCQDFAARRDPFTRPIQQPQVRPPQYSDFQEFRKRLGYVTSAW